ncbi:hypothetical protein [Ensifer aridi]|uniref:hypothetical protein n=1 Tax=Ensifer aridi TaxID=1708715 RepID=UPI00358DF122
MLKKNEIISLAAFPLLVGRSYAPRDLLTGIIFGPNPAFECVGGPAPAIAVSTVARGPFRGEHRDKVWSQPP